MKQNSWNNVESNESKVNTVIEISQVEQKHPEETYILPQTKIILKNQDVKQKSVTETKIDAKSLLGLTKEEVAQQFKDYTIETFNEKEVTLVKNVQEEVQTQGDQAIYVLGVEDQNVCIKEKNSAKRPVKIDYEVSHFSKYVYSLLLNEEIEITSAQKEALLLSPSALQKILQGYVGE